MYRVTVDAAKASELARQGYDIAASRQVAGGVRLDLVLSKGERAKLARQGVKTSLMRDRKGRTAARRAALQAVGGYNVWRSWDERDGIRDEMVQLAAKYPQILKLETIGQTLQGRDILALKLTQGARGTPDGERPATLYMSNIHAREWISVEVNRRLLRWFVDKWVANDRGVRKMLQTRELWFVLSANPDGYQYTFDHERLWRKNLRDNNADGSITNADGVDLNRNYSVKWGYDDEGSSSLLSSETFRGTGPASEPETEAMQGLIDRMNFKFLVTYHSYGPLLLYNYGWQIQTPSPDDPLYVAYTGTDDDPAVEGFDPGVAADLYITNGTTDDYSYTRTNTLSWTPELEEGCAGCGFVFPDNEALVQAEFMKNLPFALDLARSTPDPSRPVSHLGNTVQPFYLDMAEVDPEKSNNPIVDFKFSVSYGDPQTVKVLARRDLGAVTLKYRINGGAAQSAPTAEAGAGERYGGGGVYYHVMQGQVTGTTPGDTVEVWFEANGGHETSDSFEYSAEVESSNDVLVLAAEDYTGISSYSPPGTEPYYLDYYTDALAANGIGADVYDVDAHGRTAPDPLGVLSHYRAVIWYTGDDVITRDVGMARGTASRLANDEMLAVRQFLNAGGRLLYTGQLAGLQYSDGYPFDIAANRPCNVDPAADCQPLSNDFLQYYLGAFIMNVDAGLDDDGNVYDVEGTDTPFESMIWGFNGSDSAENQFDANSFITTSGILPLAQFPQFESWAPAKYMRPGGPFDPHTGDYEMYSGIGDKSYKSLTRAITVPSGGATMSFWTSYDTEGDWDYLFVEAHTVGSDDWTTLPAPGHTGDDTGESCPAGWIDDIHPHLGHYQTLNGDGTCSPTGSTGAWNATSGNSGGWQQWTVDLSAYVGSQVEVSISYASDWGTQGLGVFVDDIVVSTGEGTTSFENDGDVMDGWAVTGPPEGSPPNPNNFERLEAGNFPEGAVVATPDTLYMGFGFEGISDAATRNAVMDRAMEYLLR